MNIRKVLIDTFPDWECIDNYINIISHNSNEPAIEKHHILPVSVFPEYKDFNDYKWNCVRLSTKDHILAHYYLSFTGHSGLKLAFQLMSGIDSQQFSNLTDVDKSLIIKLAGERRSDFIISKIKCPLYKDYNKWFLIWEKYGHPKYKLFRTILIKEGIYPELINFNSSILSKICSDFERDIGYKYVNNSSQVKDSYRHASLFSEKTKTKRSISLKSKFDSKIKASINNVALELIDTYKSTLEQIPKFGRNERRLYIKNLLFPIWQALNNPSYRRFESILKSHECLYPTNHRRMVEEWSSTTSY